MTENSHELTVLGQPPGQGIFQYRDGGPDWNASEDELPSAVVTAKSGDTLRSVLLKGAEAMGVSLTPAVRGTHINLGYLPDDGTLSPAEEAMRVVVYAGFRRPDDDEPMDGAAGALRRNQKSRHLRVLVVRDSRGRAVWRRPPFDATVAELIDAAEQGLFVGDPLRPYLVLVVPQGDLGLLGEWAAFQKELETAWYLTGAFSTVVGALSGVEWVKKRLARRDAAKVVERNAVDWESRGAAPQDLRRLLASRPMHAGEVASLLGCSEREAEAILWAYGFTPKGPGKKWVDSAK